MEFGEQSGFRFQNLEIWQRAADLAVTLDEASMAFTDRTEMNNQHQHLRLESEQLSCQLRPLPTANFAIPAN